MKSKSIKGNSFEEIQAALQEAMSDGFKPTLSIIILSDINNAQPLQSLCISNGIEIFGISTSQKFTKEGIEPGDCIVILLLDIHPNHFRIVLKDFLQASPREAARQVGEVGVQSFKNPGFIISAIDIRMSGEELINGLADVAGKDVTVIGGVAGNPADFSGIVFTKNESGTKAILALVIDQDKISMTGLAVSGWKPIGTEKKITKSNGPWILTIDDEPALDVIQKFLGQDVIDAEKQAIGLIPSDLGYPLQFQRAPGSFLMMPLLLWNAADKSIMLGGNVREGESFRFSLPPDFDVIDKVIESTKTIKEKKMLEADAMLVFSCVGRLGSFGPMISTEIEGLAATWNTPMIGFFHWVNLENWMKAVVNFMVRQ